MAGVKRRRGDGDAAPAGDTGYVLPLTGRAVLSPAARGFDMSRWRLRHVALHLLYLGHAYSGLESQQRGVSSALGDRAVTASGVDGGGGGSAASAGDGEVAATASAAKRARRGSRGGAPADGDGEGASSAGDGPATIIPTIESALFAALLQSCLIASREGAGYTRCGRTDKGVSAAGQVVALRLRSKARRGGAVAADAAAGPATAAALPTDGGDAGDGMWRPFVWQREDGLDNGGEAFPEPQLEADYAATLNALLPPDIRVMGWADVDERSFSARFSATDRVYRYYFVPRRMDLPAMVDAGQRFVGLHDFRNLCRFDIANSQNFVREVISIRIVLCESEEDKATALPILHVGREAGAGEVDADAGAGSAAAASGVTTATSSGAELTAAAPSHAGDLRPHYIEVIGNAFLWHQIRCMVAVLFHVGRGYEAPSVVDALLDVEGACPSRPAYELASHLPLSLHHCGYGELGITMREVADDDGEGEGEGVGEHVSMAREGPDGVAIMPMAVSDRGALPVRFVRGDATLHTRMHYSPQALRNVTEELERQWSELALKAAMVRGMLERVNAAPVHLSAALAAVPATSPSQAAIAAAFGDKPTLPWSSVVAAAPELALPTANVDYAIMGPPPTAAMAVSAVAPGAKRSGGKGSAAAYVPLLLRPRAPSVADVWNALPPERRAAITRAHPVNAVKLEQVASRLRGGGSGEAGSGGGGGGR